MANYSIKRNTKVAIVEEDTEGTEQALSAASDYIAPLSDGVSLDPERDLLDRNVLISSIGRPTPRTGMRMVSGELPVELKASGTAGSAPEYGLLLESLLGSNRSNTSKTTTQTGNTASNLKIGDADISDFNVGDSILIEESGAYHVGAITAVDDSTGAANIDIEPAASSAFSDNVEIAKWTTYYPANSGHKSFTVHKSVEATTSQTGRQEKAIGCKTTSLSLSNFTTGQIPELGFSFEGLDYNFETGTDGYAASYDNSLPPITLQACLYIDGTQVDVNDVELTIDNSLSYITSTCDENGRIASRVSDRQITGTINPYKLRDDISNFTKFDENTEFSLFFYAANPTGTAGELQEVVAFYLPNCLITSYTEGDLDGTLQESISFSATRGPDGDEEEIYISYI